MRYSLLLLAVGLALPAAAQTTFGVRAGLNVADVSNTFEDFDDFGVDAQPRLGFVGGVFAEVPLSPSFAVRPEVLYSQKGARADFNDSDGDLALKIDYLEIPVLARFGVPVSPTLGLGLLVGPAVAFKLNESIDGFDDRDEDVVDAVDYGVVAGGEVGSGPFFVDLRYTFGLASVAAELDESEDTPRNGVFSVSGTFKFGR